jgi:hypothetical protein
MTGIQIFIPITLAGITFPPEFACKYRLRCEWKGNKMSGF